MNKKDQFLLYLFWTLIIHCLLTTRSLFISSEYSVNINQKSYFCSDLPFNPIYLIAKLCSFYRVQKPHIPSFYYKKFIIGVQSPYIEYSISLHLPVFFTRVAGNFISIGFTLAIYSRLVPIY